MSSLRETARYVRSKNAGPFWVTIDIFCETPEAFAQVAGASGLRAGPISRLYGVDEASIRRFAIPALQVLKISFPRPVAQGSTRDADSHAGQYYVALLDMELM